MYVEMMTMDDVIIALIKQAEELIAREEYLKAGELLIGAYAYRETGMLMSADEAISFLEMRFPEMKETLEPFKKGSEVGARESISKLLGLLRG